MQTALAFPQSLSEKYQPERIADFVGLEKPKKILSKFAANPYPSAWFFFGKSGTGKTSMALALAKELNAELHHIPSQQCNVQNVEDTVRACHRAPWNFFGPNAGKPSTFHIVLVDEADKMSPAAQLAFLSKLDATAFPPQTIFIFTSNAPDGLEPRFLSRTRQIEFSNYGLNSEGSGLLERIWEREAPSAERPNFAQILRDSRNNLRDALMTLETELLAA